MIRGYMRHLIIIMALFSLTGCSTTRTAYRYHVSADSVDVIRTIGISKINVGIFSTSPSVPVSDLQCKSIMIAPPDGVTFAEYVRSALISELKMAEKYSPSSPVIITGNIDVLEVDTSPFSFTGQWRIVLKVQRNGKEITTEEKYSFRDQDTSKSSCDRATSHFGDAVQNLIHKLVIDPEFADLLK